MECQDIEVVRVKQRERSRQYHQKQRMLKELQKQQEENNMNGRMHWGIKKGKQFKK